MKDLITVETLSTAIESYFEDDLEYHYLLQKKYGNEEALEGNVLDIIKESAIKILEKAIALLKKLLDYIRGFFAGFGEKVSGIALKLKTIPSRKKKMIALKIKNIEVEVASIKQNQELSEEDKQHQIDELLSQKSKLEEENKFLGQNYILSEEQFDLIQKIDNYADVAMRVLVSTHSSFVFSLEKFDYIPNMFNVAQMSNDTDLYNNVRSSKSNSYNAGVMAGTGAITGAKSVLGSASKMYNESDPEFVEYMEVIDKYMNGDWKETVTSSITKIEGMIDKINENKERTQPYSKVKVVKISDFEKLLDKYSSKTKENINIDKTIAKYKAILEKNYSKNFSLLKRKVLFFKPKAPEYLMNIISILGVMCTSYVKLHNYKVSALLTIPS